MNSKTKFDELCRNVDYLKKVFLNIAERVTKLEYFMSSLDEKNNRDWLEVTESLELFSINSINNISEYKLVEIYNDIPQILENNAIPVDLTAKSFRSQTTESILVEKNQDGKYWIISVDKNTFWLLPSINIKINIHKIKTVKTLFEISGDSTSRDTKFILIKPAKFSILPNGKEWKLEAQGMLEFYSPSASSLLETELEATKQERNELMFQVQKMEEEREIIFSQLELLKKRVEALEN